MTEKNPYEQFYDKQLQNTEARINKELKKDQQNEILGYIKDLKEQKTSPARIITLIQRTILFYKTLNKTLSDATKEDAQKIVQYADAQSWSERSRADFKAMYKQYRKYLTGGVDFPDDVRWIKKKVLLNPDELNERTSQDIMRAEDFKKFVNACTTPRDRALFGMMGELGLRPKTAIMMKIKHIDTTNKEYIIVTIPQKTKTKSRVVPLLFSKKWMLEWVTKYHPDKENPNAYLFVKESRDRTNPIGYKGLSDRFHQILDRSGIKKKFTLYDFRRFSYTFKATKGWGDQQIKAYHGLKPKSKAIDSYVKIDGKDLLDPVKELYGVKVVKRNNKEMELIICPNCTTENPSSNKQCETCGVILDPTLMQKELEKSKAKDERIKQLEKEMNDLPQQILKILEANPDAIRRAIAKKEKTK